MDFDALVQQIVARVTEKVAAAEQGEAITKPVEIICGDKPGLLVLTGNHGNNCHQILDSTRLKEKFSTVCALTCEYQCQLENVQSVVLFDLTVESMVKIATGACDTPYTQLASKALLLGKKLYVPCDQVELLNYEATAPTSYYSALREKLALLEASGLVICHCDNIEDLLLDCKADNAPKKSDDLSSRQECKTACREEKHIQITKKVITEQDMTAARANGATHVSVKAKAILTDLAKDFAHQYHIEIIRE